MHSTYVTPSLQWERIKSSSLFILLLATLLGVVYPLLADGYTNMYPIANGLIIGLLGGFLISYIEYYLFNPPPRYMSFSLLVISKALIYSFVFLFLVLSVVFVSRGIQYGYSGFSEIYNSPEYQHFLFEEDLKNIMIYTLSLTSFILFGKEMTKKLGREVVFNFILGTYYTPKVENRIFLFLDLNDSTTIAEGMEELEYHSFVNEFFKDITESIIISKGEVYQYVGDEVVVSWTMSKGLDKANCLQTYFLAQERLEKVAAKYETKYGLRPSFKAAYHCGKVIRGEMGLVKSNIAFSGDVLNTCSRIEGLCGKLKESLLISETLLRMLPSMARVMFDDKGEYELKGKTGQMKVFGLKADPISP